MSFPACRACGRQAAGRPNVFIGNPDSECPFKTYGHDTSVNNPDLKVGVKKKQNDPGFSPSQTNSSQLMQLAVSNIGRTKYADAWELQHKLFDLRHYGLIGDMLLFTEHEHVYTIGKGGNDNHLLASEAELSVGGIDVVKIDRGGDITYHGPGQVVGYPIIDLNNYFLDIHRYLRSLEEVIILVLDEFDIEACREEGLTGVWVKGEKIAAFGVKVSRWITMHGFALNVNTDLQKFERIIPCGIFHKGVTSMQTILGKEIGLEEVHQQLAKSFSYVFGCQPVSVSPDILRQRVEALQVNLDKQDAEHNVIVKS